MFDNGESYQCRLDINKAIFGFESHIKSCLSVYHDRMRLIEEDGHFAISKAILDSYQELVPVWKRMTFSERQTKEIMG